MLNWSVSNFILKRNGLTFRLLFKFSANGSPIFSLLFKVTYKHSRTVYISISQDSTDMYLENKWKSTLFVQKICVTCFRIISDRALMTHTLYTNG